MKNCSKFTLIRQQYRKCLLSNQRGDNQFYVRHYSWAGLCLNTVSFTIKIQKKAKKHMKQVINV